jgi:invasion protein IalB
MAAKALRYAAVALFSAALLVVAYIAAGSPKLPTGLAELSSALTPQSDVQPGFIGVQNFGAWRLICVEAPTVAPPPLADAVPAETSKASACRLNQEVPAQDEPGRVILSANLSTVGPRASPALMLRLPGTFHSGDSILLRINDEDVLRTSVRDCTDSECVAANDLSEEDWGRIIAASDIQVTFPMSDGKQVYVKLVVAGLADGAAALKAAQRGGT